MIERNIEDFLEQITVVCSHLHKNSRLSFTTTTPEHFKAATGVTYVVSERHGHRRLLYEGDKLIFDNEEELTMFLLRWSK